MSYIKNKWLQTRFCLCLWWTSIIWFNLWTKYVNWIFFFSINQHFFVLIDTVPNPCLAASTESQQYYPFAFSAQAFVQCNGDLLYVQPCASGLYWNQESKICDHIETSPAPPAQDQSPSYQVTYGTGQQQQQQPGYAFPIASFSDQKFVKQPSQTYQPQINIDTQR